VSYIRLKKYKVKISWLLSFVLLLGFLLSLSVWQFNRAQVKQNRLNLQQIRSKSEVLKLNENNSFSLDENLYQPVQVVGHFDQHRQFLLDNRVNAGKAGYFVFTPFLLSNSNKAVLVNRGWVPLTGNRSQLPDVMVNNELRTINGRINKFPSIGLMLSGAEIPAQGWPSVLQVIQPEVISQTLQYNVLDFQIELDEHADDGYIRNWQTKPAMTPEKHMAYAVQWLLLALTLTVLYIKFGLQTVNDSFKQ
jgi:surfeit locus 1 family protein